MRHLKDMRGHPMRKTMHDFGIFIAIALFALVICKFMVWHFGFSSGIHSLLHEKPGAKYTMSDTLYPVALPLSVTSHNNAEEVVQLLGSVSGYMLNLKEQQQDSADRAPNQSRMLQALVNYAASSTAGSPPRKAKKHISVISFSCEEGPMYPNLDHIRKDPVVVVWSCNINSREKQWSLENVYSRIDMIVTELTKIKNWAKDTVPGAIFVWAAGSELLFPHAPDGDAALLILYQSLNYLLLEEMVISLPVSPAQVIAALEAVQDNFRGDLFIFSKQPSSTASKGARLLEVRCQHLLFTRKYDSLCFPPPSQLGPVLVTGLGGSGTHFVSAYLQSAGALLYHEELGPDGSVSWTYAANDVMANLHYPWGSGNKLGAEGSALSPRFYKVFHVLREPVAHISSFSAHLNTSYEFIRSVYGSLSSGVDEKLLVHSSNSIRRTYLGDLNTLMEQRMSCPRGAKCNVPFAALSYLLWNRFIENQADAEFHVDSDVELRNLRKRVCDTVRLFHGSLNMRPPLCQMTPQKVNHPPKSREIPHQELHIEDLKPLAFWSDLVAAAEKYGYRTLS